MNVLEKIKAEHARLVVREAENRRAEAERVASTRGNIRTCEAWEVT